MKDYSNSKEDTKEYPFDKLPTPADADAIDIQLLISVCDRSSGETLFDAYPFSDDRVDSWKTVLLGKRVKTFGFTHGFGGKVKSANNKESWIEDAIKLLKEHPEHTNGFDLINFVAFDWNEGAAGKRAVDSRKAANGGNCAVTYSLCKYDQAASNTRTVGVAVATFLHSFADVMPPSDIHLLGFSLGAHVMGFAGKQYQFLNGGEAKIGRITGLDPAGPLFNVMPEEGRLAHTDAGFVDAIHTNAGIFGIKICVGHADFWVSKVKNESWFTKKKLPWGSVQPGCTGCNHPTLATVEIKLVNKLDDRSRPTTAQEGEVADKVGESHYRAHIYFRHSIANPEFFVGIESSSGQQATMGLACREHTSGSFNVHLTEWNQ